MDGWMDRWMDGCMDEYMEEFSKKQQKQALCLTKNHDGINWDSGQLILLDVKKVFQN